MTIKLMVEGRGELRRKILQSLVEQAGGAVVVELIGHQCHRGAASPLPPCGLTGGSYRWQFHLGRCW